MLEKLSPWQPLSFLIAVVIKRKNDGGCLGEMSHDASDFSTNHLFILATFYKLFLLKVGNPLIVFNAEPCSTVLTTVPVMVVSLVTSSSATLLD